MLLPVIAIIRYSKEKKKDFFIRYSTFKLKFILKMGDKIAAVEILKDVIFSNDPTYSALSLIHDIERKFN